MPGIRIAVLLHENDEGRGHPAWTIHWLARAWEEKGHVVEWHKGPAQLASADLVVPHVDLTVLPERYVGALRAHPCVVNRNVVDISKSTFSDLGVRRGERVEGPVILKTELNCGGEPERRLEGRPLREHHLLRSFRFLAGRDDPKSGFHPWRRLRSDHYPVFDSIDDVPASVWKYPDYRVERFMPERDGELFATRSYLFAGSEEYAVRNRSRRSVVKAAGIVDRTEIEPDPEVRARREKLGFDFGKFDYVMVDGSMHLFDLNRTPTFSTNFGSDDRQMKLARRMAAGMLEILA
ncbi:MAG: hypothetical protein AAGD14_07080 [Planctomycetota bacterium]